VRIVISEACSDASERVLVRFLDTAGTPGASRWGGRAAPQLGRGYDVEFNLGDSVVPCMRAALETSRFGIWECSGGEVQVTGNIESIDDDDVAYLRLSPDCLMLIDSDSGSQCGACVAFRIATELLIATPQGS
jgi:hypothetical protein